MHSGCKGHLPAGLVVKYDLLYLGMLCAFFCGYGGVGSGEGGDVVVCHGHSSAAAGRGYPTVLT